VAPNPPPGKGLLAQRANYCTKIGRIYRDFTQIAAARLRMPPFRLFHAYSRCSPPAAARREHLAYAPAPS
jgi:hypothetical protein